MLLASEQDDDIIWRGGKDAVGRLLLPLKSEAMGEDCQGGEVGGTSDPPAVHPREEPPVIEMPALHLSFSPSHRRQRGLYKK